MVLFILTGVVSRSVTFKCVEMLRLSKVMLTLTASVKNQGFIIDKTICVYG